VTGQEHELEAKLQRRKIAVALLTVAKRLTEELADPDPDLAIAIACRGQFRFLMGLYAEVNPTPENQAAAEVCQEAAARFEEEHPELSAHHLLARVAAGSFAAKPSRLRRDSPQRRSAPRGRSSHRRTRAERAGTTAGRARTVDRLPPEEPRRCGCGCGQDVPAGKRAYVDDSHSNRAAQARWRQRHRVEAGPDEREQDALAAILRAAQGRRACSPADSRQRVQELAERRLVVWRELTSANGNRTDLLAELDALNAELVDRWDDVRCSEVAR
jgi:hypothetical protein